MATTHKPERDYCASCGFPIRGHRCEACGRGRDPLPIQEGSRRELHAEGDAAESAGLDRAFEAFKNQDLPRFVGYVIAADGGATTRAAALETGPGWIAVIRGAPVFTSIRTDGSEIIVEAPIVRVPHAYRAPVLRFALELCAQDLVASRLCLRDDILLLRFTGRLDTHTPLTLRALFREIGSLSARYTELFAVNFDARPVIPEEHRSTAEFDALGQSKRLRFGPGVNRNAPTPPSRATAGRRPSGSAAAAIPPARSSIPTAPAPTAPAPAALAPAPPPPPASAAPAPPSASTGRPSVPPLIPPNPVPKPIVKQPSASPPSRPAPPLTLDDEPTLPNRSSAPTVPDSALDVAEVRKSDVSTTPIRRIPSTPQIPAARATDLDAATRSPLPDPARRPPTPFPSNPGVPSRPPSGAKPILDFDAPRRPSGSFPAVTGESALLPADRLAAMLRQAQTLASLTLETRPGLMSWLVRATVFRAVFEYREAVPDAVAHLYRCTGIGRDSAEPALLVMERIAAARCQVPAEKPLAIEPFISAPQAKEHVSRYIGEIERGPSDPAFRHHLALGALAELLVRAKLPAQTEQRLREIVTFAQREGPKTSAFDLMMTSLQRISGG